MSGEDQRTAQRSKLLLMVGLRLPTRRMAVRVKVRDISAGGARLDFDGGGLPDERVVLEFGASGQVTGRIAWATSTEIGIAFDHPVDPESVRRPVTGSYQAPPPPTGYAQLRRV